MLDALAAVGKAACWSLMKCFPHKTKQIILPRQARDKARPTSGLLQVNMHVMVAMPHILNNSVDVNASTWPAFEAELLGNMSMVMHHPALAGYYICDDCASSQPSTQRNRSIIVEIMRRHDPYHLIYGAGGGPSGEMETEDETINGGTEPAATQRAIAHGLVLDVPMVENYRNDLGAIRGTCVHFLA